MYEKVLCISFTISFLVVRVRIRRRIGQKGQIVIPKDIREYVGIMPGDEVVMEVREKEVVIMEKYKIKPRDAIHAATALENNIVDIVSYDKDFEEIEGLNELSLKPRSQKGTD